MLLLACIEQLLESSSLLEVSKLPSYNQAKVNTLEYYMINIVNIVTCNAFFSFDLFMVDIPECKQQLKTNK